MFDIVSAGLVLSAAAVNRRSKFFRSSKRLRLY